MKNRSILVLGISLGVSSLLGLLPAQAPRSQPRFLDVATSAGIDWVMSSGHAVSATGGFLDFDCDGWQDIVLAGNHTPPTLYRNLGDGNFVNANAGSGLENLAADRELIMSLTIADYDNDGDPDLFLGRFGSNDLLRNNGDGTFSVVTPAVMRDAATWTMGGAFGDYDGDGLLDLYVVNYIKESFFPFHVPEPNRLFHNEGNGVFTDVTSLCGVAAAGTSLVCLWSDYDLDGDLDLFVAQDFGMYVEPNRLYRNDGPAAGPGWRFTDVSDTSGAAAALFGMGIAAGDFDRDLDLDYYISNIGKNLLMQNNGAAGFSDVTDMTGTGIALNPAPSAGDPPPPRRQAASWGVGFVDFDLDGWLEIYVSNGFVPGSLPGESVTLNAKRTPNSLLYHSGPDLVFEDIGIAAGLGDLGLGRGVAFADYDKDGDVDILQMNVGTPNLYRNQSIRGGSWLSVLPEGRISPRDAIGAMLRLDLADFSLIREVGRNYSYMSSSECRANFGLGRTRQIERLHIDWPSGITQDLYRPEVEQHMNVLEPMVTKGPGTFAVTRFEDPSKPLISVELQNHSDRIVPVVNRLEVRLAGEPWRIFQFPPVLVPAADSLVMPIFLPATFLSEAEPVPLEVLWSIIDADGAIDQFQAEIKI